MKKTIEKSIARATGHKVIQLIVQHATAMTAKINNYLNR